MSEASATPKKHSPWRLIGTVLLIAFIAALIVGGTMFVNQSTGYARVKSANSRAKSFYDAVIAAADTLSREKQPLTFETIVHHKNESTADNPLWEKITEYYGDFSQGDYAIVCNDKGEILLTLYSGGTITDEDLSVPNQTEQLDAACSVFHHDDLIGYYIPA